MIIRALDSVKKLDVSVLPLSFYVTRSVSEIDGSLSLSLSLLHGRCWLQCWCNFFRNRSRSHHRC